jgi:hypothetical protein
MWLHCNESVGATTTGIANRQIDPYRGRVRVAGQIDPRRPVTW